MLLVTLPARAQTARVDGRDAGVGVRAVERERAGADFREGDAAAGNAGFDDDVAGAADAGRRA